MLPVLTVAAAGSECYLNSPNAPDFVGTFEGTASSYNSYQPATWTLKYPAYRVRHAGCAGRRHDASKAVEGVM
jgi:hypothetical protein